MHPTHFSTADIELAATFIAAVGARLVRVDRSDPGGPRFEFRSDDVFEVAEAYWRGEIRVEPARFADALRSLRARVKSDAADEALPDGTSMQPPRGDFRLSVPMELNRKGRPKPKRAK